MNRTVTYALTNHFRADAFCAATVDGPFSNDLLQFVQYNLGGMTYLIFLSLEFKVYISFRLLIDNMPCQV